MGRKERGKKEANDGEREKHKKQERLLSWMIEWVELLNYNHKKTL